MSVGQVNNLYYLCYDKKNPALKEQEVKKLIEKSKTLNEEWFFEYL